MARSFDTIRAAIVEEYMRSYMASRDCDAVVMLKQPSGQVIYRGKIHYCSGFISYRFSFCLFSTMFYLVASMEKWPGGLILRFTDESSGTRAVSERRMPCALCASLTTDAGSLAGSIENVEHYTEQGTQPLASAVGVEDGAIIADSIAVLQDLVDKF
jgi:hypothetical protein